MDRGNVRRCKTAERALREAFRLTVVSPPAPLLESVARATGQSRNAIVREAVERHLKRQPAAGTFGEIAGRFRGCVKGTPKDLSSHPRYLERFGP